MSSDMVAEKARDIFNKIRKLRATMPRDRKYQRDILEAEIKRLHDQWWDEVCPSMVRPLPGSIRACGASVSECDTCPGCGKIDKGV